MGFARAQPIVRAFSGTESRLPRDPVGRATHGKCSARKPITFQSENVMAGLYLGIAVTGVEALIAMALVIALM